MRVLSLAGRKPPLSRRLDAGKAKGAAAQPAEGAGRRGVVAREAC